MMNKIYDYVLKNVDKVLHITISFMLVLLLNLFLPLNMAGFLTLVVGVLKEFYDEKIRGGHLSWWDILADAIGITLAVGYLSIV